MRRTTGRVYRRGGCWWIDYQINGERFRHTLKDRDGNPVESAEAARAELDRLTRPYTAKAELDRRQLAVDALRTATEARRDAEAALLPRGTIADAWTRYLACQNRPQSGDATLEQYQCQWSAFARWLAVNRPDAAALADVTPADGEAYVAHLAATLAPGTINQHIRLLRMVYRVLAAKEVLPHGNPFAGLVPRREAQNHRKELRPEILRKVFDAADGEVKTLLFLGLYTGQRLADCCLLTWDQVELDAGWISVTPRKTRRAGTEVSIPIYRDLKGILAMTPPEARTGFVLPGLAKTYLSCRNVVTTRLQTLFKHCGVQVHQPGTGPGTKKRAVLQYGFHSLRHSTATILQEAGAPAAVAEAILGHRSQAIRKRYTHVGREALATAMRRMPSLTAAPPAKALPAAVDAVCADLQAQIAQRAPQATEDQLRAALEALQG